MVWKFDEEILRNGLIIADFKSSWQNLSTKRGIFQSKSNVELWDLSYNVIW